ncbi:MAG: ABC transporter six-transmembrane domain-containing protein [Bacteroidota bacterium]
MELFGKTSRVDTPGGHLSNSMMLKDILRNQMLTFGFTCSLILMEALLTLLFPLFIGYAIDGSVNGEYQGVYQLGALGLITLIIGAGRRFFDSRYYAKIYLEIGPKLISSQKEHDISTKSARLGMIKELVEFLEFSLPELINALINLLGVIIIIATLNINVFVGAILSTILIGLIYWISSAKTSRLNSAANDEQEKQVQVVSENNAVSLKNHLNQMMRWNIKLSDLEAVNFSISWLVLIAFLLVSIFISTDGQLVQYGMLFSLIMYVFQYMESVVNIPFFYQNWLRLQEITHRISTT